MQDLIYKSNVLIESLPYIKKFAGKIFVIKYGGHAMVNEELKRSVVLDIILLKYIGVNPIVVHGGGQEVTKHMERLGLKAKFAQGLRITDESVMEIAEMVLVGKVNKELVSLFNVQGGKGVGLSGKDANLFVGDKRPPVKVNNNGVENYVDLGFVGDITKVNPQVVSDLSSQGYIPIISTVGVTAKGETLNINADHAAGYLAAALQADKLLVLTDVEGIFLDPADKNSLLSYITKTRAIELINAGKINAGMIPKVEACLKALEGGVKRTHIIDGRMPHSILMEIFTDKGIGTMVTKEER